MRTLSNPLRKLKPSGGQSTVEVAISVAIIVLGLLASAGAYRAIQSVEGPALARQALVGEVGVVRAFAANRIVDEWLSLGANSCSTAAEANLSADPDSEPPPPPPTEFMNRSVTPMDQPSLEASIPTRLEDGTENPLRKAIDKLMGEHGAGAFSKCADPDLSDPDYLVLEQSWINQALCRCAVARTSYGTLAPAKIDFGPDREFYTCFKVAPLASPDSAALFLELLASATDVVSGEARECSGLGSGSNEPLYRVRYLSTAAGNSKSRVYGLYYIPNGEGP